MSRFRLGPTGEQEVLLAEHCRHARFVWNLAVEQHAWWTPRRGPAPGFVQQARQLTEARAESRWLAAGAQMVQQQALRDFAQAMTGFFAGTHRRPTWRRAGVHEGFRIVAVQARDVRRLSRRTGAVRVPKVGWVRFRWSRRPPGAKSYRITRDRAGRWHLAFAALPTPIAAPGSGATIGVDRGVAVSAALSNSVCGHVAAENRESQATFACRNCGHRGHADVNAAVNIDAAVDTATAAGRAVVLRGEGTRVTGPMSREPQRNLSSFLGETSGDPPLAGWRTSNRDYLHTGLAEGGESRRVR